MIPFPACSLSRHPVLGWKSVLEARCSKNKAVIDRLKNQSSQCSTWSVVTAIFEVLGVRGMSDKPQGKGSQKRYHLSSGGQGEGKDISGNRSNVYSKRVKKYCCSEVFGTLLVPVGPSSPLLQHLSSFPDIWVCGESWEMMLERKVGGGGASWERVSKSCSGVWDVCCRQMQSHGMVLSRGMTLPDLRTPGSLKRKDRREEAESLLGTVEIVQAGSDGRWNGISTCFLPPAGLQRCTVHQAVLPV